MSKQQIPARTVITCDRCKCECTVRRNYIHEGKLVLTRAALDFQGCPVADATIRLDLCDRCNGVVADAINACMKD